MHTQVITPKDMKGSLAGHLLVATPQIQESCFTRSVIYMCAHNESGAMGVIVNSAIDTVAISEVYEQLEIGGGEMGKDFPVHFGGPVEANRGFVLHSTDYASPDSVIESDGIAVTASIGILQELGKGAGPERGMLILGYAGWSPGQLESEIESGSWMVVPASPKLVFDTDNDLKWHLAMSTLGIDIGHYSSDIGHA